MLAAILTEGSERYDFYCFPEYLAKANAKATSLTPPLQKAPFYFTSPFLSNRISASGRA